MVSRQGEGNLDLSGGCVCPFNIDKRDSMGVFPSLLLQELRYSIEKHVVLSSSLLYKKREGWRFKGLIVILYHYHMERDLHCKTRIRWRQLMTYVVFVDICIRILEIMNKYETCISFKYLPFLSVIQISSQMQLRFRSTVSFLMV